MGEALGRQEIRGNCLEDSTQYTQKTRQSAGKGCTAFQADVLQTPIFRELRSRLSKQHLPDIPPKFYRTTIILGHP